MIWHLLADAADELGRIQEYARSLGIVGLLLVAIVGLYRKWWVPGWLYRETARERDEWKRAALKGTHIAERATEIAEETL